MKGRGKEEEKEGFRSNGRIGNGITVRYYCLIISIPIPAHSFSFFIHSIHSSFFLPLSLSVSFPLYIYRHIPYLMFKLVPFLIISRFLWIHNLTNPLTLTKGLVPKFRTVPLLFPPPPLHSLSLAARLRYPHPALIHRSGLSLPTSPHTWSMLHLFPYWTLTALHPHSFSICCADFL